MIYRDDFILAKHEQYWDLRREADQARQALGVAGRPSHGPALYRRALDELGVGLVRLGHQLQVQFGSIELRATDCARPGEVPC